MFEISTPKYSYQWESRENFKYFADPLTLSIIRKENLFSIEDKSYASAVVTKRTKYRFLFQKM